MPHATVAIAFDAATRRAVMTPPICRYLIGRDHTEVARMLRRRGAVIRWLGPSTPVRSGQPDLRTR